MSDRISRADAIDAVQTYLDILINSRRHGDDFTFINVLTDIRNKISALPSAEAVQGWIPCSERLPDVGRDVLFCDSEWTEEGCLRADGDWWQFRWSTVMPKEKVTAWMPLPKPYREDGEAE